MKRNSKLCVCVTVGMVAILIILGMLMMNMNKGGGYGSILEGATGGKEEKGEVGHSEVSVPEIPDLQTLLNGVDLDMSSVMKVAESLKGKK